MIHGRGCAGVSVPADPPYLVLGAQFLAAKLFITDSIGENYGGKEGDEDCILAI